MDDMRERKAMKTNIASDILKVQKIFFVSNPDKQALYTYYSLERILEKYITNLFGKVMFYNGDFKSDYIYLEANKSRYILKDVNGEELSVDIYSKDKDEELILRGSKDGVEVFNILVTGKSLDASFVNKDYEESHKLNLAKNDGVPGIISATIKQKENDNTVIRNFSRINSRMNHGETELYWQHGIDPETNEPINNKLFNTHIKDYFDLLFAKNREERERIREKIAHDKDDPLLPVPVMEVDDQIISDLAALNVELTGEGAFVYRKTIEEDVIPPRPKGEIINDLTQKVREYEVDRDYVASQNVEHLFDEMYKIIEREMRFKRNETEEVSRRTA